MDYAKIMDYKSVAVDKEQLPDLMKQLLDQYKDCEIIEFRVTVCGRGKEISKDGVSALDNLDKSKVKEMELEEIKSEQLKEIREFGLDYTFKGK